MKRKIRYKIDNKKFIEREVTYIPFRYILAFFITFLEVLLIIGFVFTLCYFVPYFYIAAYLTELGCVLHIISSNDSPDYKAPWLLFVLILPIVGFMLYFLFYSRKLPKKYLKRIDYLNNKSYEFNDENNFLSLKKQSEDKYAVTNMIKNIAGTHLFSNTKQKYYPLGELLFSDLLIDLKNAKKFIYMEYFIIEEGTFWNSILEVLKEKAKVGVDVRIIYDDIGCMTTLPPRYYKELSKFNILATPFYRLKGSADNEFNNRSHRKITVIDGHIGYTGGINIADEYINLKRRFGHWKDCGIRLEGPAVKELTRLFVFDYGINVKNSPTFPDKQVLYPNLEFSSSGYLMPFGDGPNPVYKRRVAKTLIKSMIERANKFCYITTPYLIIDNDLCSSLESAALKGVDVKIILPHIPDKKIVFSLSRSYYDRLLSSGAKIYEYEKGFIHSKIYITDEEVMIGTINLDYRSLAHHFENGVWAYNTSINSEILKDFNATIFDCIKIEKGDIKIGFIKRFLRSVIKIFAPLF